LYGEMPVTSIVFSAEPFPFWYVSDGDVGPGSADGNVPMPRGGEGESERFSPGPLLKNGCVRGGRHHGGAGVHVRRANVGASGSGVLPQSGRHPAPLGVVPGARAG